MKFIENANCEFINIDNIELIYLRQLRPDCTGIYAVYKDSKLPALIYSIDSVDFDTTYSYLLRFMELVNRTNNTVLFQKQITEHIEI